MSLVVSIGKYQYISTLQINAGVAVYLCFDTTTGQRVVCKTVADSQPSAETIMMLQREYELALRAQGPGVIEIFPLEKSIEGYPIIVFKEFAGKPLLNSEQPLSWQEYLPLFIRIVKAIALIHEKKMIHRDLNPDNILWNQLTQEIRIIDFNLATELCSETINSDSAETLTGTLPFISPEQTGRMNRKVDFRSDFYSLGMTFYHFLVGSSPFDANDPIGWVYCHIAIEPSLASERNPEVPLGLAKIIAKLLAKNAEDRYQSSFGLVRDLEHLAKGLAEQSLHDFVPGSYDTKQWLNISEKLYGRERELGQLFGFFSGVKAGDKSICTISGASGLGKSVLVHEVNRPVVEARGNLIVGKCDQFKRNVPYSAVKDALADLVRQNLAKSPKEVENLQRKIAANIGDDAKLIADLIPELEAITGFLKPLPPIPPNEARIRFMQAIERLIQILCAGGQPLVAFLDDLQWADLQSLKLIEFLMLEADIQALMIIAVYRDNEVKEGHPLLAMLDDIAKTHEILNISLEPLGQASISYLLADTLQAEVAETQPLAEVILLKTGGNPFHIVEMIKSLHECQAIRFDSIQGKWLWNMQEVSLAHISCGVVDLMLSGFEKFPKESIEKLGLAACIGVRFELNNLAAACESSIVELVRDLWPIIEKGLVIPLSEDFKLLKCGLLSPHKKFVFKFQHDRVHEAAYQLIAEHEKPAIHLKIGRIFRKKFAGPELEKEIIDIVRHFNIAEKMIVEENERLDVSQLNSMAASKARASVAFEASLYYLRMTKIFLPTSCWTDHYHFTREINMNMSETAYIMLDNQLVEATNQELLLNVIELLDRAEIDIMRVEQHFNLGKITEARLIGLASVRALGMKFPDHPGKLTVLRRIYAAKQLVKRTNLSLVIDKPEMTDRRVRLILKQLVGLSPIFVSLGDRMSSVVSVLENLRYSLKYGNCAESAYGFVATASIFGNLLGNFATSKQLGELALAIEEKYGTAALKPAIYYVYGVFVAPLCNKLEEIAAYMARAIEAGLATGDQFFLGVAATQILPSSPQLNLEESMAKAQNHYLPISKAGNSPLVHELGLAIQRYRIAMVEGLDQTQKAKKDSLDKVAKDSFKNSKQLMGSFLFHLYRAITFYMYRYYALSYEEIKRTSEFIQAGRGTLQESDFHFFNVLIIAQNFAQMSPLAKSQAKKSLKISMKRMEMLSMHQPHNYKHKLLAMKAENFRMLEQRSQAADFYALALEQVDRLFSRDLALINELWGHFYQEIDQKRLAELFIRAAINAYRNWKAQGKVKQLWEEWPTLRQENTIEKSGSPQGASYHTKRATGSQHVFGQSIDLATIAKAAQTLSSQVEMATLIKYLMTFIVENAGAHYAVLLLNELSSNRCKVVARAECGDTQIIQSMELDDYPDIALSIMLYTGRTNETVIIDDLEKDGRFKADLYLQKAKPKSVLAMPITLKGKSVGYFYLENRTLAGSFSKYRIEVLNILGTQAAISLENAKLYANLEQKVRERTLQLAEKSRDMQMILSNIKQGILMVTMGLKIHPEYSNFLESILGSANLANKDFLVNLFHNSNIAMDALDQIRSTLEFSIGQDAIGFTLNESLLVRDYIRYRPENEFQYLELDWEPIVSSDGLVLKIMVTIRDVSELKKLQVVAVQHQRELTMLNQLLRLSPESYLRFANNAVALLEITQGLMLDLKGRDKDALAHVYRNLHTIKGNMRLMAFSELTDRVHACETQLDILQNSTSPFEATKAELLESIGEIFVGLADYKRLYEERLLAFGSLGGNSQEGQLIAKIRHQLDHWRNRFPDVCQTLQEFIGHAASKSLAEIIEPLSQNMSQLALELGKEVPTWILKGSEVRIEPKIADNLANIFVHLFSNSINHGLELAKDRLEAGKAQAGKLYITLTDLNDEFSVVVSDDGRGLNLAAIRTKGEAKGLIFAGQPYADLELACLIFHSGFSTAAELSHSAGRGVGMDAVRDLIAGAEGQLELVLDDSTSFDAKKFEVRFSLPKKILTGTCIAA